MRRKRKRDFTTEDTEYTEKIEMRLDILGKGASQEFLAERNSLGQIEKEGRKDFRQGAQKWTTVRKMRSVQAEGTAKKRADSKDQRYREEGREEEKSGLPESAGPTNARRHRREAPSGRS